MFCREADANLHSASHCPFGAEETYDIPQQFPKDNLPP